MKRQAISILLIFVPHLFAMQPTQLVYQLKENLILKQEQLAAKSPPTQELLKLSRTFKNYNPNLDEPLIKKIRSWLGTEPMVKEVKQLLIQGADPNAREITSKVETGRPIYYTESVLQRAIPDYPGIVKLLLEAKANPNPILIEAEKYVISSQLSALARAVRANNKDLVTLLLQYQAKPDAYIFYNALENQNFEIAQELLDTGIDPDVVDDRGYTPLFQAVQDGNIEAIEWLITKQANQFAENSPLTWNYHLNATTPIDLAQEKLSKSTSEKNKALYTKIVKVLGKRKLI